MGSPGLAPLSLRVASYNVLAQVYVRSKWFSHSEPAACLKWKNRSKTLLDVVDETSADIWLMQEVDDFSDFWEPEMRERGFKALYKQRTQHSNPKKDGSAIFYKDNRFKLVKTRYIEFNDLASLASPITEECTDLERLMKDSVGVVAALQSTEMPDKQLVVGSAHIFWDPAFADVKLAQAKYYRQEAGLLLKEVTDSSTATTTLSIILGGDFNSMPDSDVYAHMTSACDDGLPKLISAYGTGLWRTPPVANASVDGAQTSDPSLEPPFSTVTPGFTATIDYLFTAGTEVASVQPHPARDTLGQGLPKGKTGSGDTAHPSDHLPLVADVLLP